MHGNTNKFVIYRSGVSPYFTVQQRACKASSEYVDGHSARRPPPVNRAISRSAAETGGVSHFARWSFIIIIIDNRGLNARWCLTPLLLSLPTAAYLGQHGLTPAGLPPHHCSMSSDHSRSGRPLLFEPSIIPNTRVFICLLSFILQIWPKRRNFLCITFCSRVSVN